MSTCSDIAKSALRFADALLGVEYIPDPNTTCPGVDWAVLGICQYVGPHGPHPVTEAPTYEDPR